MPLLHPGRAHPPAPGVPQSPAATRSTPRPTRRSALSRSRCAPATAKRRSRCRRWRPGLSRRRHHARVRALRDDEVERHGPRPRDREEDRRRARRSRRASPTPPAAARVSRSCFPSAAAASRRAHDPRRRNGVAKEILIVDDEVGIRELLSEILQDEGYRVALAENAGEARAYRQRAAAGARAARHLDARHRRRDAAARVGRVGPAHDARRDDVGPRHDRDRRRGDEDRRVRFPREADRPAKLLATIARALKSAAAQEPRRVSLAALGTSAADSRRPSARSSSCSPRGARSCILGEPGTGHDVAARALRTAGRAVRRADERRRGSRRIPLALLEEAREGTLYCAEIGQYSKAEQKGLAFLLPQARQART